jgi:hypothetical protein
MKTGTELIGLLGKPADDPEVVEALAELEILWPPELDEPGDDPDEEPDWYVWRPSSKHGFEFGFQDQAHLEAADPDARGKRALVLSQVYFYGQHEGVHPFAGEFPYGLALAEPQAAARDKVTAVIGEPPRLHRRAVWDGPDARIVLQHVPQRDLLDSLLVKLRLTDWPAPDPAPQLPTIDQMLALFGQPWYAPPMRTLFFPLGLEQAGRDIAIHRNADLRRHGLELYFFRDKTRDDDNPLKDKGAGFSAFKLFGPRYQDARGWAGKLPHGLVFTDAFPDLVRKMGRKPDAGRDDDLSGYAVWNLPDYTLHVLYDNVDNVLSTVTVFAPGAWRPTGP